MKDKISLDDRLAAVAGFVEGEFLIDVGTDHANLPIFLCQTKKIKRAVASDINEGPLDRAKKNICAHGLQEKIETVLSDGLTALESYIPTDIAVAGMGGILIKDIISSSEIARRAHLILQPMSHAHILREYLTLHGFSIKDETLAEDAGKVYQIISAVYTGTNDVYTDAELYIGKKNIENREKYPAEFLKHVKKLTETFSKKVNGGDDGARSLYNEFLNFLKT